MRESRVVPLDGSWHAPCVGVPQRSVASAIASVGVAHSAWELAMVAPRGGIGVVAPVPYSCPIFFGVPRGRGAHYEGDAPSPSGLRNLTSTPMRRAARTLSSRPAQPFAIEENCHV